MDIRITVIKSIIILTTFAGLLACNDNGHAGHEMEKDLQNPPLISFFEAFGSPLLYNDKDIRIFGKVAASDIEAYLFYSSEELERGLIQNSIQLHFDPEYIENYKEFVESLDGEWVEVEGIYTYNDPFNENIIAQWRGQILDAKLLRVIRKYQNYE